MGSQRLFFGLSVDPEVGERLTRAARNALADIGPVTLYGADDLHLTLCFMGEVPSDRVRELIRGASREFSGLWAPELRVGAEGGAFPNADAARSVWAGVAESADSLGRLAAIRNRALQVGLSHGCRPPRVDASRPFQPHVTLARPRTEVPIEASALDFGAERNWLPVDVTLFQSLPGRGAGGDRYQTLHAWPLAVRPG